MMLSSPVAEPVPSELPDLSGAYAVTPEHRAHLAREGYVCLRGLLTPEEVAAYRPPIAGAVDRVYGALTRRQRTLFMADSLWTLDPAARRFVLARRFAGVAAALLGVPVVRLWRDIAFFKDPKDEITPWHQDSLWEPLDGRSLLVLWIALTPVSPDMGPLTFVAGSHRDGCVGIVDHNDGSQADFREGVVRRGGAIVDCAPLAAGDATAHLGWTLHSSPRNVSSVRREAFSILYFPDGVRISTPPRRACSTEEDAIWREVHAHHMASRLPGLALGDVAASPRCPIVFDAKPR